MSGVSGVGNSNANLYELLSRITSSSSATDSTSSTASSDSTTSAAQSPFDQFLSDFETELENEGVDTEKLKGLQDEIAAAVSTALQQAEESGDTSDLKQVVQDAVNQALEDNGFDATELTQQMQTALDAVQANGGSMPPEGPGARGIGPPPPPPPSDSSETDSSTSSDSTDSLWDALSTSETEDSSSSDGWLLQLMRELTAFTSNSNGTTDTSGQVNAAFEAATSGQNGVLGFLLDVET